MIKVLLVEGEGLFRDLLARTLAGEAGLEVVGTAADGASAIRLAQELEPDVLLMDIMLPGEFNGIEAGRRIKAERPQMGIVLLSSYRERQHVSNIPIGEDSGWSYLLKESVGSVSVLVRAIESSAMGLTVLHPRVVANLQPGVGFRLARLSSRHMQVLALMAQGYNNRAIAQKLAPLGEKSVENYVNRIYRELDISRTGSWHPRVQAVLIYLEESQLATPPSPGNSRVCHLSQSIAPGL